MLRLKNIVATLAICATTFLLSAVCNADQVHIFGLDHTSLGNAHLTVVDGSLVVSNIGFGGGDGVLVSLPSNTTLWGAHINDVGIQADGSFFQMTGLGTVNGMQNQIVSTARMTSFEGGSLYTLDTDLSAVTSHPVLAQYFLRGILVGAELVDPAPVFLCNNCNNTSFSVDCEFPCFGPEHLITYGIDWNNPAFLTTPSGAHFSADLLELETTTLDATFGGYSGASWTASEISSFTINSEDFVATPEPASFVLFGSGILGLAGILRRKLLL